MSNSVYVWVVLSQYKNVMATFTVRKELVEWMSRHWSDSYSVQRTTGNLTVEDDTSISVQFMTQHIASA